MTYVCMDPKALDYKISNKNNENEISQITIITKKMPSVMSPNFKN